MQVVTYVPQSAVANLSVPVTLFNQGCALSKKLYGFKVNSVLLPVPFPLGFVPFIPFYHIVYALKPFVKLIVYIFKSLTH